MFNPSNIDEVSMQVTHLEASKCKPSVEGMSKRPPRFKKQLKGEKGKGKREATVMKNNEESTCSHFQKKGHEETQCWKFHPKL